MSAAPTRAAGAVVWRVRDRKLEVLLVHRPRYDDWAWPKGKREKGESLAECAVREVAEETAIPVVLGRPLPQVSYLLSNGRRKISHYWAATPAAEDDPALRAREPVVPAAAAEIDDVRWVPADRAMRKLTYRDDREPLGILIDQWHDEKLRTWPVLIVRHARARGRSAWSGDETTRPLTPSGEAHAERLVPLLAAYGVTDVVTSPWRRCLATVEPYTQRLGTAPAAQELLTEAGHDARPGKVRALVRTALATPATGLALCTHRPVLPTIMAEVQECTPHRLAGQVPQAEPWLKTAEVLVVHVARRPGRSARVVALETHRAPSRS